MMRNDRVGTLAALKEAKTQLALEQHELEELDKFLREIFGIRPIPSNADWDSTLRATCGEEIANRYFGFSTEPTSFYNFIAQDPLFGLVHSKKRVFILDAAYLLTACLRMLGITGRILDIGCHGGYHALWLARSTQREITGIDASGQAIQYARNKGKELKLVPKLCTFTRSEFPSSPGGRLYELIYSCDGPIEFSEDHFQAISRMLTENGVFIWIGCRQETGESDGITGVVANWHYNTGACYRNHD